jgi:hypothetical protein
MMMGGYHKGTGVQRRRGSEKWLKWGTGASLDARDFHAERVKFLQSGVFEGRKASVLGENTDGTGHAGKTFENRVDRVRV